MEQIKNELKEIEQQCLNYCKKDNQKQLVKELNDLSEDIKGYIQDWDLDYLLRGDSLKIKQTLHQMLTEEMK